MFKLNKKGGVPFIFFCLFVAAGVAGVALRPSHIVRSAVQKCVAETGQPEDVCKDSVKDMTQSERIEYIRDK